MKNNDHKMYRVLYLTQFPEIGGGETILLSLLQKLDRKLFNPIVIVPRHGSLFKKLKQLKITTYHLPLDPYLIRTLFIPGASPSLIYRLIRLTKQLRPNLIHINHLTLAIYAGIMAKTLRVPVVATAHGSWDCIYFYQDLVSQFCTDKILANTQELSKNLTRRKIVSPKKVKMIPFGVDTDKFKPATRYQIQDTRYKLGLPLNSFLVTIVGRLDPVKDHLTFLKAAKLVQLAVKNVTFYIVGSKLGDFSGKSGAYAKQIQDYLSENPTLSQKVIFGGFIEAMPSVYQATDVLVSTSPQESFGLALAEGAASGLPIIAASNSVIVENNKNGFIIPPQNPKILAKKLTELINNKTLMLKFGRNGRSHIIKNFSLEKYTDKIQNLYLSLLK